ncbi:MAG: hypothetical protein GX080_08180 [Tissierellia bacterium]|nr:hypothetical protein [Tissierellia bacterium]
MSFFNALNKLIKRKKVNGYYNSDDLITVKEKQSLLVGFSIILIPLLIAIILIILN